MRDRIFYAVCFGLIFGVLLRSFLFLNLYLTVCIGLLACALFLFFTLVSKNNWGVIASIFIFAFACGIWRFYVVDQPAPKNITMSGIIVDEPDIRENNQKLTVKTSETKILITTDFENRYTYGDEISFKGELESPENFITDQGKVFDYVRYLQKDGILYVMSYPEIEFLSHGKGNMIKSTLFHIKNKFLSVIDATIPSPESLLMGGLILGERSSFGEEMRQKLINTGTIHIIALSGYNVTIVAEWIMKLFSFLPLNLGISIGIFTIFLFILMTGASSTSIRAGIMATLALVARATGRNYDIGRALLLAGVCMILLNPFVLAFDVSFQLSFIATIALIFFTPKIEEYFLWVPTTFKLRDIVSVTCAVYIFVLPFILYKMGNLSLVALPANVLILPFIPMTMLFGFLTGFLGIFSYLLGVPFSFISNVFLHYELSVIDFFSRVPFASFIVPNFPLFLTLIIYACFIYKLFGRSIKKFFTEPF